MLREDASKPTVTSASALARIEGQAEGLMRLRRNAVNFAGTLTTPGLAPQLKILALLTILSLLPAIVLTMTSFTRSVIVLGFVRQGIGTQQSPPNQVLVGLALFLTIVHHGAGRQQDRQRRLRAVCGRPDQTRDVAFERASAPIRSFMLRQTREADLALFYDAAKMAFPKTEEEVPAAHRRAGLRGERADDVVPDGRPRAPAVSRHRPRGVVDLDVARHDDGSPRRPSRCPQNCCCSWSWTAGTSWSDLC